MMVKSPDVIVCGWGYSMRLYDFYEVVDVTDKMVKLALLKKRTVGNGRMGGFTPQVMPVLERDHSRPMFNRKIRRSPRGGDYVSITPYQIAYLKPYDPNAVYEENHLD
jgi:hypothetical protein